MRGRGSQRCARVMRFPLTQTAPQIASVSPDTSDRTSLLSSSVLPIWAIAAVIAGGVLAALGVTCIVWGLCERRVRSGYVRLDGNGHVERKTARFLIPGIVLLSLGVIAVAVSLGVALTQPVNEAALTRGATVELVNQQGTSSCVV